MPLKSWRQFVQIFRCYVWSEERGKVVEFSPVSNQNISLSSNILSYWNMYWKSLNSIATKYWKLTNLRAMRQILALPLERALPPSWGRSAGEVSQGDKSLLWPTTTCDRSESMNNLDWGGVEDEKDKRIRELEDTLRKQKELMEILQVASVSTMINQ